MLRIDKDMERLMMEKKKELLFDLEKAKKRILEELYCLRRSVHTDVCGLLADYNRIQIELRELTEELKKEIEETTESFSKIFAETYNSYTVQINQHITNFEEVKNTIVTEINEALADLTYMEETVAGLVEQLEGMAGTYVTQEQLNALKTELETDISDAVSSIDFEQFRTEVETMLAEVEENIPQSDWNESSETSKAFIKNKPFYISDTDTGGAYNLCPLTIQSEFYKNPYATGTNADEGNTFLHVKLFKGSVSNIIKDFGFFQLTLQDDGSYKTDNIVDDALEFYIAGKLSNGSFSLYFYYKCTNQTYVDETYKIGYGKSYRKIVRPNNLLLGANPMPNTFLCLNENNELTWEKTIRISSSGGNLFRIKVSDDGTLSTEAVTE